MTDTKQHTFTEAPASWNIKYRVNGFDEQITLRGESYAEIIEHVDKARSYVAKLIGAAPSTKATEAAINTEPATTTQTTTPPADNALSFEVERMEANVNAGKVSWRCKGGHFTQYGVICWPEVIKAASLTLDPAKGAYTFNPPLIAEYVLKDDGKPQKVTRLYQKPQA